jgi:hypothetical protein
MGKNVSIILKLELILYHLLKIYLLSMGLALK